MFCIKVHSASHRPPFSLRALFRTMAQAQNGAAAGQQQQGGGWVSNILSRLFTMGLIYYFLVGNPFKQAPAPVAPGQPGTPHMNLMPMGQSLVRSRVQPHPPVARFSLSPFLFPRAAIAPYFCARDSFLCLKLRWLAIFCLETLEAQRRVV